MVLYPQRIICNGIHPYDFCLDIINNLLSQEFDKILHLHCFLPSLPHQYFLINFIIFIKLGFAQYLSQQVWVTVLGNEQVQRQANIHQEEPRFDIMKFDIYGWGILEILVLAHIGLQLRKVEEIRVEVGGDFVARRLEEKTFAEDFVHYRSVIY